MIFINYRRDDTRDMAARIHDRLAAAFGGANIFMDVDILVPGQRFDRELAERLDRTLVFLCVIGPRWLQLLHEREASGERDFAREEIVEALRRGSTVTVIPVLIEQTPLPRAADLPKDIRDLVLHHAHTVRHAHFGGDLDRLAAAIRVGIRQAENARKRERARLRAEARAREAEARALRAAPRWIVAAILLVLVLCGGVLAFWNRPRDTGAYEGEGLLEAQKCARLADAEKERRRAEVEKWAKENPVRTLQDCAVCPQMVVVPKGSFMMGSADADVDKLSRWYKREGPQRKVTIPQDFALGKTEVTFDQWNACVAGGGCTSNPKPDDRSWGRGRRPVINVSHRDAQEYVAWLSKTTGQSYRLPSEAEWEYGYRAGSKEPYPFKDGKTITVSQARYAAGCTAEVGSYLPNKFGLHDMPGNVSEWVEDAWHESYRGAPTDGSVWWRGGDPKLRVVRGGAWYHSAIYLRSTDRVDYTATYTYGDLGFRVARDLKPGELSK